MTHPRQRAVRAAATAAACAVLLGPWAQRTARAEDGLREPRALGMGDAFVVGSSNGAIYHNPAGIHEAPVYSIQTGYQFSDANNTSALSASIVDAKTNPFVAAGAAYSFSVGNGGAEARQDDVRDHNVHVALAAPVLPQYLSLGIAMRYANVRAGWDSDSDEAIRSRGMGFHAGLLAVLGGHFAAGFAAQDIFTTGDIDRPRRFTSGLGASFGPVHVEAQHVAAERVAVASTGTVGLETTTEEVSGYGHGFNVGVEVDAGPVPLRAGVARDASTEQFWVGAGIGFRSLVVGVDAGYRQNVTSGFTTDRQFVVALLVFL